MKTARNSGTSGIRAAKTLPEFGWVRNHCLLRRGPATTWRSDFVARIFRRSELAIIYSPSLRRIPLRYLDRLQPLALLFMRLTLGAIMVAHGSHKVFGGLHHFAQFIGSMGIPSWLGYVSAFTEFIGGLLILAGFFTRVAALGICIDLVVAILKVHLHNGLLGGPDKTGYEFPLAAATLAFALILFGAGPISLDHVLRGGGSGFKRS